MDRDHARPGGTLVIGSDLEVSRLGFGAMRLTGPGMWGDFPDREAGIALLRQVIDAGVTFIDTADAYGPHTNEVLIHDALYPYPAGLVIDLVRNGDDHRQHAETSDMITPVTAIVAQASRAMTLRPGDLIFTGAPPGVGPIYPGDVLYTRISRIGSMTINVR